MSQTAGDRETSSLMPLFAREPMLVLQTAVLYAGWPLPFAICHQCAAGHCKLCSVILNSLTNVQKWQTGQLPGDKS